MKSTIVCVLAVASLGVAALPAVVRADPPESHVMPLNEPEAMPPGKADAAHAFAAMAGSWTGGGSISLTGDIKETLRCRASYVSQSASSLNLSIRCASDNYKFELSGNVVDRQGVLSGQWKESNYDVSGSISGRVAGNRIIATARGESFTTALAVTTSGNRQTVSITPEKTYIISVQIGLSKVETAAAPKGKRAATR